MKISSPLAWAMSIGNVLIFVEENMKENVNSFHTCTNTKVAAVAIPGATSGRIIFVTD